MSLINLIASSNFIAVNKTLIKEFGLEEAIILGELAAEYSYWEAEGKLEDGAFYCTTKKLEEATTLSDYQQRKAIKNLEEKGVIHTELKGMPAVRYFTIDEAQFFNFLNTSFKKTKEQDLKKFKPSNNINNKNNNKKDFISKDIKYRSTTNTPEFNFGKKQPTNNLTMYEKCVGLIHDFTNSPELIKLLTSALKQFLDNSREIGKPFYTNNFKGKLNNLHKLTDDHGYTDVELAIKIVQQTLEKGWNDFYDLAKNSKTGNFTQDIEHLDGMTEHAKKDGKIYDSF